MNKEDIKAKECLESIFRLQKGDKPVRTMDLAKNLGFPPSTVSTLLRKLFNEGYISYERHRGAKLTDRGRRLALGVVRRHRLSERLLTDLLGMKLTDVHREACRLEHAISEDLVKSLDEALGHPQTCPHGNPIPTETGHMPEEDVKPLSDVDPREEAVITRILDEDSNLLEKLCSLGMLPGTRVHIRERSSLGALVLVVGGSEVAISEEVASKILIKDL